jgi:hypothetical protein
MLFMETPRIWSAWNSEISISPRVIWCARHSRLCFCAFQAIFNCNTSHSRTSIHGSLRTLHGSYIWTRIAILSILHPRNSPHMRCLLPWHSPNVQCTRLVLEGYHQAHLAACYLFDERCFLTSELHLMNCPRNPLQSWPKDQGSVVFHKLDVFEANRLPPFYGSSTKGHGVCMRVMLAEMFSNVRAEFSGYGTPLSDSDKDWFMTHLFPGMVCCSLHPINSHF